MKYIYRGLYCYIILLIITVPLVFTLLNSMYSRFSEGAVMFREPELNGVSDPVKKPSVSLAAFRSGEFQTDFEKYFTHILATRKLLSRLYNQILYNIFNSTESSTVIIGRKNYLYELAYPQGYLTEVTHAQEEVLAKKLEELEELKRLLNERGVALIIRMSPSKAEHYPEYLPPAYDRFIRMKNNGEYGPNWYQVFTKEIAKTNIPYYDRYDLFQDMKRDGHIVFTKGGIHWTLVPMAEYINGLNAHMEKLLNKNLGRMIITSEVNIAGKMGINQDSDIWDICRNALYAKPNYLSPNVTFNTLPGKFMPNILNVGQSFSNVLLYAIYNDPTPPPPVWNETYFSYYNSRVDYYSNSFNPPWKEGISEKTDDFELYLSMDVIMIEFLEISAQPLTTQFEFVNNMLRYLKGQM
jgi:hypothetical protein